MVDKLELISRETNFDEDRIRAETGEVVTDDVSLPVDSVQGTDLSRFEPKVTIGDYSLDSDQQLSSWIISSLVGGALIHDHVEGATDQRFRFGTAWTLHPGQLALPPKVETLEIGTEIDEEDADAVGPISMPLIEINGVVYVAAGKEVHKITGHRYLSGGFTVEKVDDLPAYAVGPACMGPTPETYFVPMGEAGVAIMGSHLHAEDDDTFIDDDDTVLAVSVVHWDRKVWAATLDGYLRVYAEGESGWAWEAASDQLRVAADEVPRGVEVFYDREGNLTLFLVTDKRLWGYDPENSLLYPSTVTMPKHHNNALGFTQWRDDALYVSTGFGVVRTSRDGVRTFMGLDRDRGIPPEALGQEWGDSGTLDVPSRCITSLTDSNNYLIATVAAGKVIPPHPDLVEDPDDPQPEPEELIGGRSYVAVWNEAGWHILAENITWLPDSLEAVAYPTHALVTETVGGYRVWWGMGAMHDNSEATGPAWLGKPVLHTMALPRNFHGPQHAIMDQHHAFAPRGYIRTGWFDAGMKGFDKTASHLEVYLAEPEDDDPGQEPQPLQGGVDVLYRIGAKPREWISLGSATKYGRNVFPFGVDGDGFSRGITDQRIEFEFRLYTNDENQTPVIEAIILKFIKIPLPSRAWTLTVPLDLENYRGMGPQEMDDYLARKTYEGGFSKMYHGDRAYRVRFSQHQMLEGTGDERFKVATVNIVTVPVPGDEKYGFE